MRMQRILIRIIGDVPLPRRLGHVPVTFPIATTKRNGESEPRAQRGLFTSNEDEWNSLKPGGSGNNAFSLLPLFGGRL